MKNKDQQCLDGFATVDEVAAELGLTMQWVRKLIRKGSIRGAWKGRQFLIPRSEIGRMRNAED